MYAEVASVKQLSPSVLRVTLTGGTLDEFEIPSATDAYINARFVPAESPLTVPFAPEDVASVAPEHRPRPRRFTIRQWQPESQQLAIDFVAHGNTGFAGAWAQRARPGDRLQFSGPSGNYRPSPNVDWHLFAGDESALGGIGASLEQLPATARALVFVVVDGPGHEVELPTAANADIVWLHRSNAADPEMLLADAIAAASFPAGDFDAFVHGEAAEVRAVRQHLQTDRNVDVSAQSISPYWRRRHSDEAWRAVKRQWLAEQAQDA